MKTNKFLIGISFAAVCALISACGNPGTSSGPTSSGGNSEGTSQTTSVVPEVEYTDDLTYDASGKPIFEDVELNFWSISIGADGQIQQSIVDKFNREFDGEIHINRQEKRHDEFSTAVVNTITEDPSNAPDLVVGHGQRIAELKSYKIFNSLNKAIELSKIDFNKNNYFENIMDDYYYDDNGDGVDEALYGLPLDVHSNIIIYRKDIILKNGLSVPTNYSELVSVCKTLANKAKEGTYQYKMSKEYDTSAEWKTKPANTVLYPFYMCIEALDDEATYALSGVIQNGGKIVDDSGLPAFNTNEVINYFDTIRKLMYPTDGTLPIISQTNPTEFMDDFYKGNIVFASTGPWNLNGIRDIYESAIGFGKGSFATDFGIMDISNMLAFDTTKAYSKYVVGTSHAFSISKTCKSATKAAAAMVFADWMTKQYTDWLKGGHLPALKSGMEDQDFLNDEFYLSIGQYLGNPSNIILGGRTPYYTETFGSEVNQGINEVWHQTFNTESQNKPISQIVTEQYMNSLTLIAEFNS